MAAVKELESPDEGFGIGRPVLEDVSGDEEGCFHELQRITVWSRRPRAS